MMHTFAEYFRRIAIALLLVHLAQRHRDQAVSSVYEEEHVPNSH